MSAANESLSKRLETLGRDMDNLAADGLAYAKNQGADEAKTVNNVSFERRLVVEGHRFTLANTLQSQSIGLAVHKDQKKGSVSTNDLEKGHFHELVDDALRLASFSVADPALTMPTREIAPQAATLPFLFDTAVERVTLDELKRVMDRVMEILTADKRVALDRFEMSVQFSRGSLMNSHGVHQSETQSLIHWSYLGMARDGDDVSGMDYDSGFSFAHRGFEDKLMAEAALFVKRVLRNLHPRKGISYKGPVIFSPRAVHEILLGDILYHCSGRQVMDGKSRWEKSLGQAVASPWLSLRDEPHNPALHGATAYDADGLPTKTMMIMDKGVLQTHLHDCYSAKKTGVKPHGAAGAPFALIIAGGDSDLASMARARGEILYVDRFSGNSNALTGDFSGVAKSSRLFVGGEDAGPVSETMIAGNVFELIKNIQAVSREQELVSGAILAPHMLVDGVTVSV